MEGLDHLSRLPHSFLNFLNGGVKTFSSAAGVRLCSAPSLVSGDFGDVVAESEEEGRQLVAAASGSDHECCQPVVDSTTWLAVIGGLGVAVFFLRNTIISTLGRRRKRAAGPGILLEGQLGPSCNVTC